MLHNVSAICKVMVTLKARQFGEVIKQCCGGHGFLQVAGIAKTVKDYEGVVTAEGDANVLSQQTASYLLKNLMNLSQGKKVPEAVAFLAKG